MNYSKVYASFAIMGLIAFSYPASCQSNDCLEAETFRKRMEQEAKGIIQKEREIFIGLVCSVCNRPASQIYNEEHIGFPQHLNSVHGIPIATTLTKYNATQKMKGDYDELETTERIYKTYEARCGTQASERDDQSKLNKFNRTLKNDTYGSYSGSGAIANAVIPGQNSGSNDENGLNLQAEIEEPRRLYADEVLAQEPPVEAEHNRLSNLKLKVNYWFKKQLSQQSLEDQAWQDILEASPTKEIRDNLKTIKEFANDEVATAMMDNISKCAEDPLNCEKLGDQLKNAPVTFAHIYAKNHFDTYKKMSDRLDKMQTKTLLILERWTR